MVSFKERFSFLKDGVDFPFYNDVPKLAIHEWLLLLAAVVLMVLMITVIPLSEHIFPVAVCLVMLIPALYVCKGDYGLFFKKPTLRDFLTIILCLFGYYVYVVLMTGVLKSIGYNLAANSVLTSFQTPSIYLIISTLMQLVGEEFFKIFMLLIIMYVIYRFTKNRLLSIWIGVVGSLFVFGIVHFSAYGGNILQILLIQGLGSIFDLYVYLKTKNVVNSYILHVFIDYIPFTMVMVASAMNYQIPGM